MRGKLKKKATPELGLVQKFGMEFANKEYPRWRESIMHSASKAEFQCNKGNRIDR